MIQEIILEGVISILEGMNHRLLETKLMGFIENAPQRAEAATARASEGAA